MPQRARDTLLEIEKDRIVFNMQMSVLTFIIRQARECQEKVEQAERLHMELLTLPENNERGR